MLTYLHRHGIIQTARCVLCFIQCSNTRHTVPNGEYLDAREHVITYYVNLPDTSAMDSTCCFEKGLNLELAVISTCYPVNSSKHSLVQQDSPSGDRVAVIPWRGVVNGSDVYGNHVGRSH